MCSGRSARAWRRWLVGRCVWGVGCRRTGWRQGGRRHHPRAGQPHSTCPAWQHPQPPCPALHPSTVAQAEREWGWKLETQQQEVAALTARARQARRGPRMRNRQHAPWPAPPDGAGLVAEARPHLLPSHPSRPVCSWRTTCRRSASALPPMPPSWAQRPSASRCSARSCSASWSSRGGRSRVSRWVAALGEGDRVPCTD